ncbi:MAG TPA: serine hydrolase [Syntrophobacteria bacterium]|nr:serine hydrolase [Syntrophobacteria bacterium]
MSGKKRILDLLNAAAADGVFPGAVLLVSRAGHRLFLQAVGQAAIVPSPRLMTVDTVFDLASLTKPLATTLAVLVLVDRGRLPLDASLAELLQSQSLPADKAGITLRQLLSHSAGFPAWKPYYVELERLPQTDRQKRIRELLLKEPLEYPPGRQSLYSDLGFLLIQWLVEEKAATNLHHFTRKHLYDPLGCRGLSYRPLEQGPPADIRDFAATENCPWRGRVVTGEVHDENAYALGGVAGQAGLFGAASDVGRMLDAIIRTRAGISVGLPWSAARLDEFLRRAYPDPANTWALGFDTPAAVGSSAGRHFSRDTVGHLGFTGTSFWVDLQRKLTVILLTNRIHPTRANEKIKEFRPVLHDAVMEEFG